VELEGSEDMFGGRGAGGQNNLEESKRAKSKGHGNRGGGGNGATIEALGKEQAKCVI